MVYVDRMRARMGRMVMCHMIADSTDELLTMADAIGVQRKWLQDRGTHREHFDVCVNKKNKALKLGARELSMKELAQKIIARLAPTP